MFDTLVRLLAARGGDAKAVVWAHNSHVGNPHVRYALGIGV
jgi:erythromycin esterase-like protein